jgi:hypothetical protein
MMTRVAVDWVTLSTPEFVAWTRAAEVRLPFPLNTGAQPYVAAPSREEITRTLAERALDTSPVLTAARTAFAEPRLSVYAVRATPDGGETKVCSVAARGDQAVLVLLDPRRVAVREIADTELAAGVVGALPPMTPLRVPSAQVTVSGLREVDAAIESGVSPRTLHTQMSYLGFPEELIALRERSGTEPATSGALGALGYEERGEPRHSTRSATWREFAEGVLLQVERGVRHGEPVVLLTPATADAMFRAAADAVTSVFETGR